MDNLTSLDYFQEHSSDGRQASWPAFIAWSENNRDVGSSAASLVEHGGTEVAALSEGNTDGVVSSLDLFCASIDA